MSTAPPFNPRRMDKKYAAAQPPSIFFAKLKEVTKPSTIIDSVVKNVRFLSIFAVFLISRYGNHISLCQVLFCVSLVTPLYLYITYAPFLSLKEDIKWIRRESRVLRAILEDAAELSDLRDEVDIKAHQIFDPSLYSSGITIEELHKAEAAWVANNRFVVRKAKDLVAAFQKHRGDSHPESQSQSQSESQSQRIGFARISEKLKRIGIAPVLENLRQIEGLITKTKRVKEEIENSISMKRAQQINICDSLERLKSNIRSLLDRPIIEQEQQKWADLRRRVTSAADLTISLVEKIKCVITQNPGLMSGSTGEQINLIQLQLQLLHPFLKDVQGLRLESKVEEAWVEEIEEIINEGHAALDIFLRRPAYGIRISSWSCKAIRNLKRDISDINFGFTQLLERKERYGFKFVRRDSSKFVHPQSQYHNSTSDDRIISFVIYRMRRYLIEKSDVIGEATSQVTMLCNKIENMHKLLGGDAGMIDISRYTSRMAWLEQMRKIAQLAEKSVETLMRYNSGIFRKENPLTTIAQHAEKSVETLMHYSGIFRKENPLKTITIAEKEFSGDVDQFKNTINLLVRSIKAYDIESREESSSVVGLEEDVDAAVSELTSNGELHSVRSISGIKGIGKTTLAKKIFYHGTVVSHFSNRVWFSYPRKSHEPPTVKCKNDHTKENRWFIVLDNISTQEELDGAVNEIGLDHVSRILFTTRDHTLASKADFPTHEMRLRTKEESWKLFSQMAQFPLHEERLAKQILGKCGGFPLAILRLGYLMSGKDVRTSEDLERVLQYIMQNGTPLLGTYTTITDDMITDRMLKCLSYLTLFPTDYEIPTRRLVGLWIAEDLVEVNHQESYEDVAERYLLKLIDRDMIQVVERKFNGGVKTCRLPYAIEKLTLQDMNSVRLTLDGNSKPTSKDKTYSSIISFDTREGNKPGEEIGNLLGSTSGGFLRQLLVLDLEGVFKPALPKKIGKYLSKLRYLGLRWTYLESIPESIGELQNLRTLDVKHTNIRTLPGSIWKLQELRHLYLNQGSRTKSMHQQGRQSSLQNLQTLWGVFLDKDMPLKDGLHKLTNLRKLGLSFQLDKAEQTALADWIKRQKHLQSLRLKSVDKRGKPCDLSDVRLSDLGNLSSVNLSGKLICLPGTIHCMPENVTDLTLSFSGLSNDPMSWLERLPHLKLLCLYFNSFKGKKMTCSTSGFKKLIVLKLWKLEQLEDWDVEENTMQSLRVLEIRSCKRLNVPSGLSHLNTLTELKLTNMPKEFSATIAENKGRLWDDFNHSPAIIAVTWEESAD